MRPRSPAPPQPSWRGLADGRHDHSERHHRVGGGKPQRRANTIAGRAENPGHLVECAYGHRHRHHGDERVWGVSASRGVQPIHRNGHHGRRGPQHRHPGAGHLVQRVRDLWQTGTAAMLSLSATAPTMPSGYTYFARVGAVGRQAAARCCWPRCNMAGMSNGFRGARTWPPFLQSSTEQPAIQQCRRGRRYPFRLLCRPPLAKSGFYWGIMVIVAARFGAEQFLWIRDRVPSGAGASYRFADRHPRRVYS